MNEATVTAELNRLTRLPCAGAFGLRDLFGRGTSVHRRVRIIDKAPNRNVAKKTSTTVQPHHVLMNIQETADYVGCTAGTLYAWVSQKRIPYVKIGRLTKFDQRDINAWIDKQKVAPFEH